MMPRKLRAIEDAFDSELAQPCGAAKARELRPHPYGGSGGSAYRRVIVRREPDPERYGEIYIPNQIQRHARVGVVRFLDEHRDSRHLRVGDRVLFGPYSGSDVVVDGETLTIMPVPEVIAVLEPHAVVE